MPTVIAVVGIVATLVIPFMLLFIIGLQAANPLSDKVWTPPDHRSNPFRFSNPLFFFHFAAFCVGAAGIGALVSVIWNGLIVLLYGGQLILAAVMLLVGVRWCMRVFSHKMVREQNVGSVDPTYGD
jgi:hypothetical protein